jgi:hypothetical protein
MILVDSTVLIDYLRRKDRSLLKLMKQHDGAVCGIIRAEVLHGARDPKDRQRIVAALNALDQILIPDTIWDIIGDNLATLRSSGLTVPFNECGNRYGGHFHGHRGLGARQTFSRDPKTHSKTEAVSGAAMRINPFAPGQQLWIRK